jgi:dihydrolipoamide dehydrogenase
MDVPAPVAGTVRSVAVRKGDKVSEGSVILVLEAVGAQPAAVAAPRPGSGAGPEAAADRHVPLVVLGGGPGGYTAAFRAADLGQRVVLVERYPTLGGVCLNVGCIPSKALLHAARVIAEAREMGAHGVAFGAPRLELAKLRSWKESVVKKLTGGLAGLAKSRQVEVIQGRGEFTGPHSVRVDTPRGELNLSFDQAIIAAGSSPVRLPFLPENHPRVLDSTGALALPEIPGRMLVIGGGIIGLEMATVYQELGARVTVVELTPSLLPGVDADLVRPLAKRLGDRLEKILLHTRLAAVEPHGTGLKVRFEGAQAPEVFDYVLSATGRRPNGKSLGAETAGVQVDERGFIPVDRQQRTNVPHLFAIGDIVGPPMLAHKAVHEGKVAAEVCAGHKRFMDARCIPAVAYTDPEVAWVGLTENEAKDKGIAYGKGVFPWAASGRALGLGREEGSTKLLFEETTGRVIGAGMVGVNAGDLIAEAALAIEMGCHAEDLALTIHPHPTLSETLAFAAEMFSGSITDLMPPKKKG